MNFFSQGKTKADPVKVQQLKTWIYELLKLDREIAVSISQLQCQEPGCLPIETAITVFTRPAQQFKIHKAIAEIEQVDLIRVFRQDKPFME